MYHRFILCCLTCLWVFGAIHSSYAQIATLDEINTRRNAYTRNGMIVLNSWSAANVISGTVGVFTAQNPEIKHFHEMNIYWNVVNLGICIPSLVGALKEKKQGLTLQQTVRKQHSAEKVFLFNGFLDIAYVTTGVLLREIGRGKTDKVRDRLRGYGDSLLLQGGFLLFFDFVQYALHHRNGKRIDPLWQQWSLRPYGAYGAGMSIAYHW